MPQFWLLGVAASISYFVMLGVTSNMILVVQSFGGSVTAGATMAVPLFAAGLISKLVAGFMIDRFGSRPVWIASLALMFAGCALFIPGQIALVPFASLLLGLGWGANYTLIQARVGDLFPTASLGRVLGAITLLDAGGAAAGPFVMAYIADTFDSYQPSFVLMCALLVVAAACWNLLERSRKW